MENLTFDQTNRTPHHGQSRGQQTLARGRQRDGTMLAHIAQHAPFKARPLEAGSPLRSAARDDRDAGRGRVVRSPRYASLPMISFESRRRLTLESFANRNARTDQRSPAARGAATVAEGFAALNCSATFDLRATPGRSGSPHRDGPPVLRWLTTIWIVALKSSAARGEE